MGLTDRMTLRLAGRSVDGREKLISDAVVTIMVVVVFQMITELNIQVRGKMK